jgi:tetratricopeptide (TPR) repeat protein/glycosyltransferase involved in cell wall biosynthesis
MADLEWYPLKLQKGLSDKRRIESFFSECSKLIDDYKFKIILSDSVISDTDHSEWKCLKFMTHKILLVKNDIWDVFYNNFKFYISDDNTTNTSNTNTSNTNTSNTNTSNTNTSNTNTSNTNTSMTFTYDNLINVCFMVKDAGDDFRDILTRNKPYMDRYTILDTGSTDNTLDIIRDVLSDKKGNVYQEAFINFRDSRNRLLELAGDKCFFNIILDDSYYLTGNVREFLNITRGDDVVDSFSIAIDSYDCTYMSNRIVKTSRKLKYINKIHEIIQSNNNLNVAMPIKYGCIVDKQSEYMTKRTSKRKLSDLEILMDMYKNNEDISRTIYYIADTYLYLEDWENALKWFRKRVEDNKGYTSEIYDSLYYISVISDTILNRDWNECLGNYIKCYEYNPLRSDPLYFMGLHYRNIGEYNTAFLLINKAFELGEPSIDMSFRKNIYNIEIPKLLTQLCYILKKNEVGIACCDKMLDKDKEHYLTWKNIFTLNMNYINLNITSNHDIKYSDDTPITNDNITTISRKVKKYNTICFVSPGGWSHWTGETLQNDGLGGSETFTIRYAETLCKFGYEIMVFCHTNKTSMFNGVTYSPVEDYVPYIKMYTPYASIINRYVEYIPVSDMAEIPNIFFVFHDICLPSVILPYPPRLKAIFCISDWQLRSIKNYIQECSFLMKRISYGVDDFYRSVDISPDNPKIINPKIINTQPPQKKKYNFIYPSFPNRGLTELLKMFILIHERYPDAHLDVFCDLEHEWTNKHWKSEIESVKLLLKDERLSTCVTNHGWVNKQTLISYWKTANVWLYPCKFAETCCLTSYEASISKTLIVCPKFSVFEDMDPNRALVIEGDVRTQEWQNEALSMLFYVLDTNQEHVYTDVSYEWAKSMSYDIVVGDFVKKYIKV